ncbi:MAG: argininosuccinate lyase [Candidatus Lernaella stagnicola]|nr:argininosuccinate lyase [Candidatus Lernaella stagnicola]
MTLYRGRIDADTSGLMDAINRSLPVDIRLLPYDVLTNRAWTRGLARLEILSAAEEREILAALDEIAGMTFSTMPADEDVHTLVERLVTEKVGAAGGKIHTGRSRNDQVACDLRLYLCDALTSLLDAVCELAAWLADAAESHVDTLLPGMTHMQPAQPISLGHFLMSLAFALMRDARRLRDAFDRTNHCPLGAGALAGSGFAVDRERLAKELGFEGVCENAMDAVSDRDFAQEAAAAAAVLTGHLSRYAEQFVLWAGPAFGYLRFADAWSTGSSMMPQKRNPDAMELVRGKAARGIGHAMTLLSLTKGVPLSYAKDLQEDKAALFDAMDTALLCVAVFHQASASATFDKDRMRAALSADLLATDLADALTMTGVPFRLTHERVARVVSELEAAGRELDSLSEKEIAAAFPEFGGKAVPLSYDEAVARRTVRGGTAPAAVREQIARLREALSDISVPPRRRAD